MPSANAVNFLIEWRNRVKIAKTPVRTIVLCLPHEFMGWMAADIVEFVMAIDTAMIELLGQDMETISRAAGSWDGWRREIEALRTRRAIAVDTLTAMRGGI